MVRRLSTNTLYYMPNATGPPPATVIVPQLETLLSIEGTSDPTGHTGSVTGIKLQGLTFTHSLTTFLGEYEVPSGGDWSMHRGGGVFATGSEGLRVEACHFDRLGGNALMISEYARDTTITDSEFSWIGDSGISQMGSVKYDRSGNRSPESNDLMDATDGMHPEGTRVQGCVFREIGVYGKQVSGFASALGYNTVINGSIFFNGPRAGINWNDGMGGGNSITQNLLFNWVRETSDHGNFNSWDRLPFITSSTGKASTDVNVNNMAHNFVISNYASTWPLDHDDGSCYYHDTYNFLVWAGAKNFLGQAKVSAHNVYVNVEANGMGACAVDDSPWMSKDGKPLRADVYANNTCITASGNMYHYSRCDPEKVPITTDNSYGNTFLTGNKSTLGFSCGKDKHFTLAAYQAAGYEKASVQGSIPSATEIAKLGRKVLGI